MRIVRASLWRVRLPLRTPLVTAHGRVTTREGFVVALEDDAGRRGYGETLPLAGFGLESLETARVALESVAREHLVADDDLDARLDAVEAGTPRAPGARAALDAALHDLAAQSAGLSLAAFLAGREGRTANAAVAVSALLEGQTPEAAVAAAHSALSVGARALKLKVGVQPFSRDLARVAAVREAVGDAAALRLDANGTWEEDEALAALERLAPLQIAFVEQPIAAGDVDALARVRARSPIAIAADESVTGEQEARVLLERGAADLLVLKPAALGGLRAAWRIAAEARRAGVDWVVTNFLDSTLGSAAALHLAAALPGKHAAGLATSGLLAGDLAPAPAVRDGEIRVPKAPGLGVGPSASGLDRWASGPGWTAP